MKKRIRPRQSVKFPEICPHCVSIFVDKHKIDQKIKDRKIDQVEKHQKRQNIIWKSVTYVLPGGGHLWIGFPGLGAIYLFIFFGFVLKIVFWNGIMRDSLTLYVSGSSLEIVLFSLFFLGFYFFVTWDSYRKKEIFEDEYDQVLEAFSGKRKEQRAPKDESTETKSKGKK